MGWTKKQLAEKAFEKIGFASYVYDLYPEQIRGAIQDMDNMMAAWNEMGVNVAYPVNNTPNTSFDQDTGVPVAANLAIYMNLGLVIAPGFGKVLAQDFKTQAANAYAALLNWAVKPMPQMCIPGRMPIGAGNKYWNSISYPFFGSYRYGNYSYRNFGPTPFVEGDE